MVLSSLESLGRRRDNDLNLSGRKKSSGRDEAARRFLQLLPRRLAAVDNGRDDEWDEVITHTQILIGLKSFNTK